MNTQDKKYYEMIAICLNFRPRPTTRSILDDAFRIYVAYYKGFEIWRWSEVYVTVNYSLRGSPGFRKESPNLVDIVEHIENYG